MLLDVSNERADQLVYAYEHLLPIWERWTDGNLAMRRAIECDSADPPTHEERRNILFQTQCRFQCRGDSPANMAAMLAAQACQYALLGYPIEMVEQVGAEAIRWHEAATTRAGSMLAERMP
jgi:hypothetical protein